MTKVQISVTLVTIFSLELVLACTECSMLPVPYQLLPFFLAYLFVYVHPLNINPSDKVKQQEHDKRTLKKKPSNTEFYQMWAYLLFMHYFRPYQAIMAVAVAKLNVTQTGGSQK